MMWGSPPDGNYGQTAKRVPAARRANDIMGGIRPDHDSRRALRRRGGAEGRRTSAIGLLNNRLFPFGVAQPWSICELRRHRAQCRSAKHAWPILRYFGTAGGERIFIGVVTEGHWQSFAASSAAGIWKIQRCAPRTDGFCAEKKYPRRRGNQKTRERGGPFATLSTGNIALADQSSRRSVRDPHVLRPGGLSQHNADGEASASRACRSV